MTHSAVQGTTLLRNFSGILNKLITPQVRQWFSQLLFGNVQFSDHDEYDAFRYRFLVALESLGVFAPVLFVLGQASGINPLNEDHLLSVYLFGLASLAALLWLRGKPERLIQSAWLFEIAALAEFSWSLLYVPSDELRVLWYYINIPCVFILRGQRIGWYITGGTMLWLLLINRWLSVPYSNSAMATAEISFLALGTYLHIYSDRSLSFFTRMREYNERLRELASKDPLTGALNARGYYAICDQMIHVSQRNGQSFAVLFVDLDHFKSINDTHGHAAGDEVLRVVSRVLQEQTRTSDLVGRIGGEEFSVFLPNTDREGAASLAETLRLAIELSCPQVEEINLRVTASIGVADSSGPAKDMHTIQQHADAAMYEAKQGGRNRVSVFSAPST